MLRGFSPQTSVVINHSLISDWCNHSLYRPGMKLGWIVGVALVAACASSLKPAPAPPPPAPVVAPGPPPAKPSMNGIWLGTLDTRARKGLRLQVHIDGASCSLDSLDQRAIGIPCTNVATDTGLS